MGAIYNQTASAAGAGKIAACSGATPIGTQAQSSTCTVGGTAGGAVTVGGSQFDIGTNLAAVYFEIDPAATDLWKAGNYVVRQNVTTLNANITWTATYICRLNSSNVSQATIGSLTGQTTSLGTTGVKTHTVSGAAQTPGAGDKIYIVCVFSVVTSNNQSFGLTLNQAIDTPIIVGKTAALSDGWANLADSAAKLLKGYYKVAATDAWQNLADSVAGKTKRLAWRDSVAKTLGTAAGTSPKTFSGSDSLNLWADSPKGFVKFFAGLTDPALNLTDSATQLRKGYLKPSLSDPWNNLNDSLAQFQKGYLKPQFTDAWNNLADSLATLRKGYLKPQLSDAWNNLADALAKSQKGYLKLGLTDPWNNLADSLAQLQKGYLKIALSDTWGTLNDSVSAFFRYRAAFTDTLNLWSDLVAKTLTSGTTPKTFSGSDALVFADSLAALRRERAAFIDSLNLWSDSAAKTLGVKGGWHDSVAKTLAIADQSHLIFAATDTLNFWSDVKTGRLTLRSALTDDAKFLADYIDLITGPADAIRALLAYRVRISDSAFNLNDALGVFLRSPNLRLQFSDGWNNLGDSIVARERFLAKFTDAVNLWNDLVAKTLTTGITPINKSMADAMLNLNDSLKAYEKFLAHLNDGMTMNDALITALTGGAPAAGAQHRRRWRRMSA